MMRCVDPGPGFDTWRSAARRLIGEGVPPTEVLWESDGMGSLFGDEEAGAPETIKLVVSPAFIELARAVSCHADGRRWALLYRILWRIAKLGERSLLEIASDRDVAQARMMAKNVRREIHKMHAFVRFRKAGEDETGRECFVAWFEPDHFCIELAAGFFAKRFANMNWSIFTPKGCAHWMGEELKFSPGVERDPCNDPDAMDAIWRTYYRSIFNPARLKLKAMQAEMPKRYWKNLPEAELIEELTRSSANRMSGMIAEEARVVRPVPRNAYLGRLQDLSAVPEIREPAEASIQEIARMVQACRHCPLWENATCAVAGEGPADARLMIVGEQPGDREDLEGRPFVGPAGQLLDRAMKEAGLDRNGAYITNAVKHFKWVPRGKIRLHQKPSAGEIDACKPWVLAELAKISPDALILLGGTAARSLLGAGVQITKMRGIVDAPHLAKRVILTVHPSYLLRLPDEMRKEAEFRAFVKDLSLVL
ncbi:UdgX family uracil-DNA binding protein [Luteolibacter luteus]|uniref:Type-4 uracil-DNA glycosylase n=2 Tax=Luteolibacter luteus TaxID=2728835 RepID=A0A858RM51_9BACT|nr:UdgX family uracil-DNA binding protein [Luteolibacter luteus]